MILTVPIATYAYSAILALSSTTTPSTIKHDPPVAAIEIIKAYGSLAGPECFGRVAPPGSSCQAPLSYLKTELGLDDARSSLTKEEFYHRLNSLSFQWPLKPYGLTSSSSLSKTATMNKGAETAMYMNELERRGLYDRRNPTGPLPTSLRPKLNAELDREGLDRQASDIVFEALSGGDEVLTGERLDWTYQELEEGSDALDYYSFLDLVGDGNIIWPRK